MAQLRITVTAQAPDIGNQAAQVMITGALPQRCAQIASVGGKKAGLELAVSRKAEPAAVMAKGLADRSDDSDFSAAVIQ